MWNKATLCPSVPSILVFSPKPWRGMRIHSAMDGLQARAKRFAGAFADGFDGDALQRRLEEAGDDQPLGLVLRYAAAHEVKLLLGVHLADGAGVGAAHVAGHDLQLGDG